MDVSARLAGISETDATGIYRQPAIELHQEAETALS